MSDEFDHRCASKECPYEGQVTGRTCGCHLTREQMMLAKIEELREEYPDPLHVIATKLSDMDLSYTVRNNLAKLAIKGLDEAGFVVVRKANQ